MMDVMLLVVMPCTICWQGGQSIDDLRAAKITGAQMKGRTARQRGGHVALGDHTADQQITQQRQEQRRPTPITAQALHHTGGTP